MEKIIINAFGPDKPGLVYKISKIILSYNGNIENSKMILLESDFTILMLVKIESSKIESLKKELNNFSELDISFRYTNQKEKNIKYFNYSFSISVADNEGIIYLYSDLFRKHRINIENMETEINNAPISGFPIFILKSLLNIPCDLDIIILKKELKNIAQENNIEYKLEAI
jgi:glycine cleavage system transcriptional repressor